MLEQEARIRRGKDYSQIYKKGRRLAGKYLIIFVCPNQLPRNRFGIVTSKKIGNAVVRNRAKRQLRAIIRKNEAQLPPGNDVVVVARYNIKEAIFAVLERDLLRLLKRAVLS